MYRASRRAGKVIISNKNEIISQLTKRLENIPDSFVKAVRSADELMSMVGELNDYGCFFCDMTNGFNALETVNRVSYDQERFIVLLIKKGQKLTEDELLLAGAINTAAIIESDKFDAEWFSEIEKAVCGPWICMKMKKNSNSDILQLMNHTNRNAVLRSHAQPSEPAGEKRGVNGSVLVKNGEAVFAFTENEVGEKALIEILRSTHGILDVCELAWEPPDKNIFTSVNNLLMSAALAEDESANPDGGEGPEEEELGGEIAQAMGEDSAIMPLEPLDPMEVEGAPCANGREAPLPKEPDSEADSLAAKRAELERLLQEEVDDSNWTKPKYPPFEGGLIGAAKNFLDDETLVLLKKFEEEFGDE